MTHHRTKRKGLATFCPACGVDMHFRRLPTRGSTVTCQECQSFLKVQRLAPLTLEWAFEDPFDDGEYDIDAYPSFQEKQVSEDADLGVGEADADWQTVDWPDDWDEK